MSGSDERWRRLIPIAGALVRTSGGNAHHPAAPSNHIRTSTSQMETCRFATMPECVLDDIAAAAVARSGAVLTCRVVSRFSVSIL